MRQYVWCSFALVFLVVLCKTTESRSIVKREVYGDVHHHGYKDKAKIEAKFGIKNAVLGLVFNKINSFIDQKTAWIDHLDKSNIAKNKAHGIEPPKDAVASLSGIISGKLNAVPGQYPHVVTTTTKRTTTTEDIVIFEKDKNVNLEIPDKLFGSSFTLVSGLSTAVGDYMINSALRLQRLLESMRPFLRGVFGAKGIIIEATTDKPIFSDNTATIR